MSFRDDVLRGLATRPRAIPARWFYDERGSALFEAITEVAEYYPTRVETAILKRVGPELAGLVGPGRAVFELGSGSSAKTPLVLDAISPTAYVPIDISGEFLRASADALRPLFPELPVIPVEADFLHPFALPDSVAGAPSLGFFPGSTIGNMGARAACDLLRSMRSTLGEGAMLLIGMDRVKDPATLERAYDDAGGVTAAFNRNLLERINRELGGDLPFDAFTHRALWNEAESRIEMHLLATRDLSFTIAGERFAMAAGETIHTENSYKYSSRDARMLLATAGWSTLREWTDPDNLFAILLAEAREPAWAP